jgi:hypothetical protein
MFTGRRMSGQEVGVPLGQAPPIALGDFTGTGHVVGILDTSGFPEPLRALAFF